MGTILIILVLIISIIAGFSGMTIMFLFPLVFIIILLFVIISGKYNNPTRNIEEASEEDIEDNTLEEHFMFTEITDHNK